MGIIDKKVVDCDQNLVTLTNWRNSPLHQEAMSDFNVTK